MKFKQRTLSQLADMICGNNVAEGKFFAYRSSSILTQFFRDCDTDLIHDGSTRAFWTAAALENILLEPHSNTTTPPEVFLRVIKTLMDPSDATGENQERKEALNILNKSLSREGFEAFYGDDKQCYLRHIATNTIPSFSANPHRPFSPAETKRREQLSDYLDKASEDQIIEDILLPLFRQLGFHRITPAGHKDKALEYGKDIWMKFTLPTLHILYFGIQVKKAKLDASGDTKATNANIAEIYNQTTMMLGHEVFDPEIGKRVLVDHAFIIAGGEITKAARNWLGGKLDASKRSQVMFMDRVDILNLYIVTNLPLPKNALPKIESDFDDDIPF